MRYPRPDRFFQFGPRKFDKIFEKSAETGIFPACFGAGKFGNVHAVKLFADFYLRLATAAPYAVIYVPAVLAAVPVFICSCDGEAVTPYACCRAVIARKVRGLEITKANLGRRFRHHDPLLPQVLVAGAVTALVMRLFLAPGAGPHGKFIFYAIALFYGHYPS
jgi:hypothetical protein